MHRTIRKYFLLILCLFFSFALTTSTTIFTHDTKAIKDVCNAPGDLDPELREAFGCGDATGDLPTTAINIVKNVILVSGLVAVVFIILGGVEMMTSNGDAAKIKKGKDTVIYAVVGLIICALAFIIVNWTITSLLKQGANESQNSSEEYESL